MTSRLFTNGRKDWLLRSGRHAQRRSRKRRSAFLVASILFLVPTYYSLAFGRVVLNGSDSLTSNAFLMVTWPKWVVQGSFVAMKMPDPLRAGLDLEEGQAVYVKRVLGVAGDNVQHVGTSVCLNDICLEQFDRASGPPLALWTGKDVPVGSIFVAGESASSLDSRYAVIGPRSTDEILAVGVPIAFPDWQTLRSILDGGG